MCIRDRNETKTERHPLLPSGDWEGFYCYHYSPEQHKMFIELNLTNGIVSGSGIDDVAPFTWSGSYDLEKFKLQMTKKYHSHEVFYKGDIDENGIWGIWEIVHDFSNIPPELVGHIKAAFKNEITGGFHIWPKKQESNSTSNSMNSEEESEKLKELFVEIFS